MAETIVTHKRKGFISLNAHPAGCAENVRRAVEHAQSRTHGESPDGCCVVLGASTGYGLASAITAAFAHGMPTVGVCLERGAERNRTATAGWYNAASLHELARRAEVPLTVLNADCFAHDTKRQVLAIAEQYGPVRLLIYSVASPVRVDPDTGETYRSVLKPIGSTQHTKTVKLDTGEITTVELEPATDDEVENTRRVMGGDDWQLWVQALADADAMAPGFQTVAYTYLGPSLSHPIYRSGSIGSAKADLEATAHRLATSLAPNEGGAWTSVNGAAVTQSSTAIPTVPLYLSLLRAELRDRGRELESVADQIDRLFAEFLLPGPEGRTDDEGRIRVDDWELDESIQAGVLRRWEAVTTENLPELGDFVGFERAFHQLFGFEVDGVDYDSPVEVDIPFEGRTA
jgi:enoyl-[acyl-carrier protein] reductase / trans-2-enoyl-CoA reductase (NAD+)